MSITNQERTLQNQLRAGAVTNYTGSYNKVDPVDNNPAYVLPIHTKITAVQFHTVDKKGNPIPSNAPGGLTFDPNKGKILRKQNDVEFYEFTGEISGIGFCGVDLTSAYTLHTAFGPIDEDYNDYRNVVSDHIRSKASGMIFRLIVPKKKWNGELKVTQNVSADTAGTENAWDGLSSAEITSAAQGYASLTPFSQYWNPDDTNFYGSDYWKLYDTDVPNSNIVAKMMNDDGSKFSDEACGIRNTDVCTHRNITLMAKNLLQLIFGYRPTKTWMSSITTASDIAQQLMHGRSTDLWYSIPQQNPSLYMGNVRTGGNFVIPYDHTSGVIFDGHFHWDPLVVFPYVIDDVYPMQIKKFINFHIDAGYTWYDDFRWIKVMNDALQGSNVHSSQERDLSNIFRTYHLCGASHSCFCPPAGLQPLLDAGTMYYDRNMDFESINNYDGTDNAFAGTPPVSGVFNYEGRGYPVPWYEQKIIEAGQLDRQIFEFVIFIRNVVDQPNFANIWLHMPKLLSDWVDGTNPPIHHVSEFYVRQLNSNPDNMVITPFPVFDGTSASFYAMPVGDKVCEPYGASLAETPMLDESKEGLRLLLSGTFGSYTTASIRSADDSVRTGLYDHINLPLGFFSLTFGAYEESLTENQFEDGMDIFDCNKYPVGTDPLNPPTSSYPTRTIGGYKDKGKYMKAYKAALEDLEDRNLADSFVNDLLVTHAAKKILTEKVKLITRPNIDDRMKQKMMSMMGKKFALNAHKYR